MKLADFSLPTELSPRTLAGLCLTISCLLLVTLVYNFWQWRSDFRLAHQVIAPSTFTKSTPTNALATIKQQHLFGQITKLGDMPISSLQLQVTGIVKKEHSTSKAYISFAGQISKIYKVGDALPYGVKLYDILPNAVVLQTDTGQLEKLPLPRTALHFKTNAIPKPEEKFAL